LLERHAGKEAVGLAQRVEDLEVVQPRRHRKLDLLPCVLQRGREIAALPLEFGTFLVAMRDRDRAADVIELTPRRQRMQLPAGDLQIDGWGRPAQPF